MFLCFGFEFVYQEFCSQISRRCRGLGLREVGRSEGFVDSDEFVGLLEIWGWCKSSGFPGFWVIVCFSVWGRVVEIT